MNQPIEIDFISNDSVEAYCSDEIYIRNVANTIASTLNTIASTLLEFVGKKIESEGPFYRVCIGAFNIKDNAIKLRNEAISKGFKDAYITT